MNSGHKILAWLMLLSIVLLFFFPLSFGSYQSTHGPTTTMDAAAATPVILMDVFTLMLIVGLLSVTETWFSREEPTEVLPRTVVVRDLICSLRC